MERFTGHLYSVEQFEGDVLEAALNELVQIPDESFDLLQNPFEKKLTLHDVKSLSLPLEIIIQQLELQWCIWAEDAFGVKLKPDQSRHYCSVFKYLPGGFLSCHVDAGIHPLNGARKHITTILYLGEVDEGGELELWGGYSKAPTGPVIFIKPEHGKLVLFENNPVSWHAVSECLGKKPRYVITVSYLSQELEKWHQRQRAYFAPRPMEEWDEEQFKLRDLRADRERFAEVYRTE